MREGERERVEREYPKEEEKKDQTIEKKRGMKKMCIINFLSNLSCLIYA